MKLKYFLYDVFTNEAFSGGQLSIVEIPKSLENNIPKSTLQKIAREFNYPETVFLFGPKNIDTIARI